MRQAITKFAALMNRTGSFRCDVARNAARKRKLFEEALQTGLGLRNLAIDFAVRSFEISICDQCWPAVPGPRNINRVQMLLADQPVQMNVDEVESGRGSPV